ncbi:MAG: hypothetical protein HC769_35150 [Cyanobacteria bacterium CRU_2_1]|nr:hypothetical protein [Cyanobacteria bacterium CRU_2_1]
MCFFPKLCAFNLSWHEQPTRSIYSYASPQKGWLTHAEMDNHQGDHSQWYAGLPVLALSA